MTASDSSASSVSDEHQSTSDDSHAADDSHATDDDGAHASSQSSHASSHDSSHAADPNVFALGSFFDYDVFIILLSIVGGSAMVSLFF